MSTGWLDISTFCLNYSSHHWIHNPLIFRRSTDIIGHLLHIVCAFSCFHNCPELYITVHGSDQHCNPLYINILMFVLCIHICFVDTTQVPSSSVVFFLWYILKYRFQTPYNRITSTAVCTLNFEHGKLLVTY